MHLEQTDLQSSPIANLARQRKPRKKNLTEPQPLLMLSHKFQKQTSKKSDGGFYFTGTSASNGADAGNGPLLGPGVN
jgi:hypothetical protein